MSDENNMDESKFDLRKLFLLPKDDEMSQQESNMEAARGLFSVFNSYIKAGFTREESLELITAVLAAFVKKG